MFCHSKRMNEISKLESYRTFKTNLLAVAAQIGAVATRKPREGDGVWRVAAMDNAAVEVEITYTNYPYNNGPALYIGSSMRQKKLTNLTPANLKKHLIKHLSAKRKDLAEWALDEAKDDYSAKAEKRMVEFLNTELEPAGFKPGTTDIDSPEWRSERGWFKLAYIHVTGTVGSFTATYNIEYDLKTGPGREIHVRGEFDAVTSAQVARTIAALRAID